MKQNNNERGGAALALKPEHAVILNALKVANIARKRLVTVAEIIRVIPDDEAAGLKAAYRKGLTLVVSKILPLLQARGLVCSPGVIGGKRYYGSTSIFTPEAATLPDEKARRRRVMDLVRGAVAELKRAVRSCDVVKYAEGLPETAGLSATLIARDMLNLAHTKDLLIVGVLRGDERGVNLYLPSDLDPKLYMLTGPLTWLDAVAHAFNGVWTDHRKQAEAENRRPRPVSTGEVRARLVAASNPHPKSSEPYQIINALQGLSKMSRGQSPLLRKIHRRNQKAILWAPADVAEEALDIGDAYTSDSERVGAAVERAVKQLGRPVTLNDVKDEVEMDPALRPASSESLFKLLSDASKENIGNGEERKPRVIRRVYRVGKVGNEAYYYHSGEGIDEARSYVEFKHIESQWSAMCPAERLTGLGRRLIHSVAVGEAMLIVVEAGHIREKLDGLLTKPLDGATRDEAEDLRERVSEIMSEAGGRLNTLNHPSASLPEAVRIETPGWTAEELLPILQPLYPLMRETPNSVILIARLWKSVRRIPNPEFRSRFSKSPRHAAEYLFDRADALLYAGKRWGGRECSFQARTASAELGRLRDVRFILPALQAEDIRVRLAAVACLAFLWSAEVNERLRQVATGDREPGVRKSALWAYGFAGGEGARELARQRMSNDSNAYVREFAGKAAQATDTDWWMF